MNVRRGLTQLLADDWLRRKQIPIQFVKVSGVSQASIEVCAGNEATASVLPAKYRASVGRPRFIGRAGVNKISIGRRNI